MRSNIARRTGIRTATLAAIAVAAGLLVSGPAHADTGTYVNNGNATPTSTGTLGTGVGQKLTGAQMVQRALDWVSHNVSYNQGQSFSDAEVGGPYRTDCGGLVDMAWQLTSSPVVTTPSPGIDSSTYSTKLTSWSQLQPGDALAVAGEHINLFAGWINQSAGTFHYIAEDNPSVTTGEYSASTSDTSIDGYPKSSFELLRSNNLAPAIPAGFSVTANAQQDGSTVNLTSTVTANGYINYVNYVITGPGGYNQTFRAGGGPASPNTTGYAYTWNTNGLTAGTYSVQPVANEIDGADHSYAATGVTVAPSGGNRLYGLSSDKSAVSVWNGTGSGPGAWTVIGGAATQIYAGGFGLFATNPNDGSISKYNGTPGSWTVVGGPGATYAVSNDHLYGLSSDKSAVSVWNGTGSGPGAWTAIGGAATQIYAGGFGLFATNPNDGSISKYNGTPGSWTVVGGPGATYAVSNDHLYGLSSDKSAVSVWNGTGSGPGAWTAIGGAATQIYAGGFGLFATNPNDGSISKYNGTPGSWTVVGGPGATYAVGASSLYGISSDFSAVSTWTGSGTSWTAVGDSASEIAVGS
ncbi:hypothetical protein [Streptacidiphilus rugosus]|uniref:hypothetical protein n=1 Tax=Streptacidiphilus rugosus TaxID=405783 RepID=UPI000563DF6C|nr:hypothetical protein [Streptacidiphilus rugosus]